MDPSVDISPCEFFLAPYKYDGERARLADHRLTPYSSPSTSPLRYVTLRVLPAIALASILSGIFLVSFIMLLLRLRLLRRSRARQPHNNATHHDRDRDHHESDLASETGSSKEKRRRGTPAGFSAVRIPSPRASLNLEPNQPIFVDVVVVESADADGRDGGSGGPRAGLQFILTPPTPGK